MTRFLRPRAAMAATAMIPALALASPAVAETFPGAMDRVFGPGGWRVTSGYRTPAHEDALRREGAGTVAPGRLSTHSVGSHAAPGAYDVVVDGIPAGAAKARLERAGHPFQRVVAESARGGQGPHLHIELVPGGAGRSVRVAARDQMQGACARYAGERITDRIVDGRRNPLIACEERWRKAQAAAVSPSGAAVE